MNLLRLILGIPLAFSISSGMVMLFANINVANNYAVHNAIFNLTYHAIIAIICFFAFVFLSCLLIPSNKKYAALIAVVISIILNGISLYAHFNGSYNHGETTYILLNHSARIIGLLLGIDASYELFKNKGWNSLEKLIDEEKAQQDFVN
jgi:glucan phosphoethanolaminetransferase (alkaline phosphatase superfamily)